MSISGPGGKIFEIDKEEQEMKKIQTGEEMVKACDEATEIADHLFEYLLGYAPGETIKREEAESEIRMLSKTGYAFRISVDPIVDPEKADI